MTSDGDMRGKSSNYVDLYKYNGVINNQNERRNKQLQELKKRRNDAVDELRNVTDIFEEDEVMEVQTEDIPWRKKTKKRSLVKIMLSEWMVDVPEDLEENWYYKVCPKGVRNLIIANDGITKAYNRRNQIKAVFCSALPGGGDEGGGASNKRITLLDCIYRDKTFYVLDVLAWNSMSLINCSAEFRFYFLESKLSEDPRFLNSSKKFKPVPHKFATRANISDTFSDNYRLEDDDVDLPVDGVLFYHKDSIYTPGITPLVGWLKPYMMSEKLDILVSDWYLLKKPESYTNLEDYVQKKSKLNKKEEKNDGMDCLEEDNDQTSDMEN